MRAIYLLGVLLILLAPVLAGDPPGYRYGEAWWQEYVTDSRTAFLLHFGRPQPDPRAELRERLIDPEVREALERPGSLAEAPEGLEEEPIDDAEVPAGIVLDYGTGRQRLTLGPGAKLTPTGRFGDGLALDGTGGLKVARITGVGPIECCLKADKLPVAPVCLLSIANDEARLLLHPDGTLELKLKSPHGILSKLLTAEQRAVVLARDATIRSQAKIAAGRWHHVVVYNKEHVVQGAGSPFDATIRLDGTDVANYLSENNNGYTFLGRTTTSLVLGNSATLDQGFVGTLDEVRVSNTGRDFYERPPLPWRDMALARPVQFNRPFFRRDSTLWHASFDKGARFDLGGSGGDDIVVKLATGSLKDLLVEGIRGKALQIDPVLGFPRLPAGRLGAQDGALEFWLRPVNWDDNTGYWSHTPPLQKDLTVMRLVGADANGKEATLISATLPRAFNNERSRIPLDPGHWLHVVVNWDAKGSWLFVNGKYLGKAWRADAATQARLTPKAVLFGVPDKVTVQRREEPLIEIDEVVAYSSLLAADEVEQAEARWKGALSPIKLYTESLSFKWSLQRLEFALTPLLPEGVTPAACTVTLQDAAGKAVRGPLTDTTLEDGTFYARLNDRQPFPYGKYKALFTVRDPAGKVAVEGVRDWDYVEEPWRHFRGGILDTPPAPWTPIQASPGELATRMTRYRLGADGLPTAIVADGTDLLAGPVRLLENDKPLTGIATMPSAKATEATWGTTFTGTTLAVKMSCTLDYDGMVRYELALAPKGPVGRLTLEIPLKAEYASRYLYYPMGARGVSTGASPTEDGMVFESRADPAPAEEWKGYQQARKKAPTLTWEAYWAPKRATIARYNFYGHLDLNDRTRGLWWLCDNAAGWAQSPTVSAIQVVRTGNRVVLRLNFIAEPGAYTADKPIVFALLPHPARPLPKEYRLFERVDPKVNNAASTIFDCFRPWPMDPRGEGSLCMRLFPAADPKQPAAGPSWDYAERCIPSMKSNKPTGLRTLYLSRAWFSCRAGAYDGWEWRSGETGTVSLTPSFVNYLCWEMNEWIRRGIWEAIYLDECYEMPTRNVEAGQAVLLPDGTVQPGVTNFQFRELMKRWRNLFTQHGKAPILIGHHTYSWQYHGLVFCDAVLDGENRPIVSIGGRDWIDSTGQTNFEAMQNARLWGVTPFYMPFIAEGGFEDKERSQFPRWQWRMARQAQSEFAHYETATVYEGQGGFVYKGYWNDLLGWGAGDPATVSFHPYWDNTRFVQVPGQGTESFVSLYKGAGKALLIISNHGKEAREIPVTLNLPALGLRAVPAVKSLDSTLKAPKGLDFVPAREADGPQDDPDEPGLDQGEDNAGPWAETPADPTLAGSVLTVPVRARDYRVVTLE
jgi:hypothetical protein